MWNNYKLDIESLDIVSYQSLDFEIMWLWH
jgi:hypothetical protein